MKILKDSFIYIIGEITAKAIPFLLLPYLARRLGSAGFGELSFYQTICSLLFITFSLSQDGAIARYVYVYGKRNLISIIHTAYLYTFICSTIALLFAWLLQSLILAAVIITAATQSIYNVQLTLRQCQKQALSYTFLQIGSGISTSLLTITLLELTTNTPILYRFIALFLGYGSISLIAYFWYQSKNPNKQKHSLNYKRLILSSSYLFSFGTPLILHNLSNFTKGQLDRILIYQNYSKEQLGIYVAALQIASIFSILLMAINKATIPHYYQAIQHNQLSANTICRWAIYTLIFASLPTLLAYMLPEKLFLWILGTQYIGVHHYIWLFIFGFALSLPYYLLINFLFYHAQNTQISIISILSTLVYILTLFITLSIDIQWIPLAMIAGNISILPLLYFYVRKTSRLTTKHLD